MPKDTFFRLPPEKRNALMDAARHELARSSFTGLSINSIIKDANISRGSFYQYFADKTDLLDHVIADYLNMATAFFCECLKTSDGDIFSALKLMLDGASNVAGENKELWINMVLYVKARDCGPLFMDSEKDAWLDMMRHHGRLIDTDMLNYTNDNELANMASLLLMTLRDAIASAAVHPEEREVIRANFANKLEIMKRGMALPAANGGI